MKIGEILSFHEHLFSLVATTVYTKFHIGYSLQWYFCCFWIQQFECQREEYLQWKKLNSKWRFKHTL